MTKISVALLRLTRIEIEGTDLIIYPKDEEPEKISLIGVTHLNCSYNHLTSLPDLLPESLKEFRCSVNELTRLPALPKSLKKLFCNSNQITKLPDVLPDHLEALYCSNNPLSYIPFMKVRPRLFVPDNLKEKYSVDRYQEGYRLQETNRYLFLTLLTELGIQIDFFDF